MISLVVVNYRTAALAREAVRSARGATSSPLQVVVVDNSCDPAEAASLREVADTVLTPEKNLGYAAAINAARSSCTGDVLILSNPDVVFEPGAIDRLVAPLQGKVAVTGPALFWDDGFTWCLPPADRHSGWEMLDAVLAGRSLAWSRERDRRRFRRRVRFWELQGATKVRTLSGAVLAVRRADFDAVQGFDERFFLYFEETDFLRRIEQLRRSVLYVPEARCRHLFNQSAGQDPLSADAHFDASELRYLEKWNGPFAARLLRRLQRPARRAALEEATSSGEPDLVVEASPLESFATAAGHLTPLPGLDVPADVWRSYKAGVLYLRLVVRDTGEVRQVLSRFRT